jgi:hypothetical protein
MMSGQLRDLCRILRYRSMVDRIVVKMKKGFSGSEGSLEQPAKKLTGMSPAPSLPLTGRDFWDRWKFGKKRLFNCCLSAFWQSSQ